MKRTGITIICTLMIMIIATSGAFAQIGFRTGIRVGYNWASMSGDTPDGIESRKSLAGGISVEMNLLIISIQADILYSPKGAVIPDVSETHLNYISIPIVLKKKFLPMAIHPYILGGPEFSYLLSAKAGDTDIKDHIKSQEIAIVVGGGIEFSLLGKSAYIEGRYSYGLTKTNKEGTDSSKNRVCQIFVGILF